MEHWFINPRDLVGAATNFPKRKIRFSVDEIIEVYELKFYYYSKIKKTCSRKCYRVFSVGINIFTIIIWVFLGKEALS